MRQLSFPLLLLLATVASAQEDSWTYNTTQEETYTLPSSEEILKWCDQEGKKVRYSHDPVPGYRLCGELQTKKLCDPSGRRFIGQQNAPYTYKDCTIGERIVVTRHEAENTTGPGEPMTQEEQQEAQERLTEIQQNEAGELARQLQGMSVDLSQAIRSMRKSMGAKID